MNENYSAPAQGFLREQQAIDCLDCQGVVPELGYDSRSVGVATHRRYGGGSVVLAPGPITQLHIIPHGGTELPEGLLEQVPTGQWPQLARLAHDNADTGTGYISRSLRSQVATGALPGAAIATFHVSRLLLDANRVRPADQVPQVPYIGTAGLYSAYQATHRLEMLTELLDPWVLAVNSMIVDLPVGGVIYHHHTLDLRSHSTASNDVAPLQPRPPFQLFGRKILADPESTDRSDWIGPADVLEDVAHRIAKYIADRHRDLAELAFAREYIDYPLRLPGTPWLGMTLGDRPVRAWHQSYELRKDLVAEPSQVTDFLADGCWRI